jgi:aspartate/methionine/tyrosine aminotransferase
MYRGMPLHQLSDRVLALAHEDLAQAAEFLDAGSPDMIDLSSGSPRFDIIPSGSTKLPAERRGWPPVAGIWELRILLAETLSTRIARLLNPADEVLVTAGAAGAFSIVLDTFVNPGDGVVLFDPSSPLYSFMAKQRRARIRWVPTEMENGQTRLLWHQLARALRGARLLVVNSPINPTGGIFQTEDMEQIAWWAARRDVLIVNDQTFESYEYDSKTVDIATFPPGRLRTLAIGSVSKSHALASVRVGWLAGSSRLLRPCTVTAALQTPFVSTLCQQIALAALRQDSSLLESIRADFDSRRRYTFERLKAMGLDPAWPAGGFFFWAPVHTREIDGRTFSRSLADAKRVRVTPGHLFGPSGHRHVRVSYALDSGRLREGLNRMADFIHECEETASARAA